MYAANTVSVIYCLVSLVIGWQMSLNLSPRFSLGMAINVPFSVSTTFTPWTTKICTLLEPKTEFTRRQKIGRGLRLCVNQNGERIDNDKEINQLYVVSDENFAEFAAGLQKNYEDDLGITFDGITIQFLSEIKSEKQIIQTTLDDKQIAKTIELNRTTGAVDDCGVVIAPEKIAVPVEVAASGADVAKIVETIKTEGKVDESTLQAVFVEIKTSVKETIPADVLQETLEEFAEAGYLGKNNVPTEPMKKSLKKGADALKLPERAEYARQEIFDFLSNQYTTPDVSNADNIKTAIAKREVIFSDPFRRLWDKIKTKTYYKIELNDDIFKMQVLLELNSDRWMYVSPVQITYADARIDVKASGVDATSGTEDSMQTVESKHRIPDILRMMSEQCKISKRLAAKIFTACGKHNEFLNNPQVFLEQLIATVNKVKARMEVTNIIYIPTGASWDAAQVFDKFEPKRVNVKTNAVAVNNSLYDYIKYDSEKTELRFAEKIDGDKNIVLFLKLPGRKYTISTPVGEYTPDWAIIKHNVYGKPDVVYFVIETKGTKDDEQLRKIEDAKIECAKKHYKALGFEVVEGTPLVDTDSKYTVKTNYKDFALEG